MAKTKKEEKEIITEETVIEDTNSEVDVEVESSVSEEEAVTQEDETVEVDNSVEEESAPVEDATEEAIVEESEEEEEEVDRSKGEWFIIQTYSSQEYKVKRSLDYRVGALKLEDKVFEILIPEEDIIEVKNNKKVERAKKMYPGYIFVRMVFDNELWYVIKRIPGISKFMGNQNTPMPVTDAEMLKVLRQVGVKVQKYQIDFEISDVVKIIAGPFRGYTGPVTDISMDKGKLKSLLLIFGRETPVEIDFDQVEKAVQ